jgi:hypothetical protein
VILPAVIALSILAVLLALYLRRHGERDSPPQYDDSAEPKKFDTTLGEFHDMREALRPLQHTRAASRRDPRRPTGP